MRIFEVSDNKRDYMDLLFLADEQEDMIDKYLDGGKMYVLEDDGVKGECVVTDEGEGVLELKNIATVPESHGKGYGRCLINCHGGDRVLKALSPFWNNTLTNINVYAIINTLININVRRRLWQN